MADKPNQAFVALVKAAMDIPNPAKDSTNAAYKHEGKPSQYASLNAFLDAIKPVLKKHGLALFQPVSTDKEHGFVEVQTMFAHESGDQVTFPAYATPLVNGMTQQAIGGCISYMRRYSLQSALGLAAADNDAEDEKRERQSSGNPGQVQQPREASRTASKPNPTPSATQPEERPTAAPSAPVEARQAEPDPVDGELEVIGKVSYHKAEDGMGRNGKPYTKHRFGVKPDGGGEVVYTTTFERAAGNMVAEAKESGQPVRVRVRKGNYGWDMMDLAYAAPVTAGGDDSDIPF